MTANHKPTSAASRARVWFSGLSVLLNLALLAVLLVRRVEHSANTAPAPATDVAKASAARRAIAVNRTPAWESVATDDLRLLTERLRALGFPAATIREIVGARINARFAARLSALTAPDPDTPYWRRPRNGFALGSAEMEEYTRLQHERAALLRDLLKDPFFGEATVSVEQHRRFGDMPAGKIEQVRRIEDDYAEMNAALTAGMRGLLLSEDRARLALLEREKRADLAALLTTAELADYEVRSSPLTAELGKMLGGFAATDAEFRAIYAAHRGAAERFTASDAATPPQMVAAGRELAEQVKTALGETRYNDYVRETNPEFQQLTRVAEVGNIPAENVLRAYNLRETVSRESDRIERDTAMTPEQKRASLQAVASSVRTEMNALFGARGADAVGAISWLSLLERGYGVSFGPVGSVPGAVNIGGGNWRIGAGSGVNVRPIAPIPPPSVNPPRP